MFIWYQKKDKHSSFQRCKHFEMTRIITNKTNGKNVHTLRFFVDVDMFYKSAHHFLYQICGAWNAKIGAKCQ